ncbi:MAG: gliding motility-associated ABC transporter substrate-binding protein GldG [Pseudopedobacter saltans]|uniref:Gliding motility-associated ABC transporter substrate-binding protein GldG n=1 Tax=Pseudopedobacter saltans TaxID=151895 RepID=A0A2W5F155_9SPHI|nr:MAG: gliding motility-associated ABC transporter substrate-binding protein GldG [Pseudopedobacter saltans]
MAFLDRILKKKTWWVVVLALLVVLAFITSFLRYKIDLTAEKRFTITQPSKELLSNIHQPVDIQVFLSGDLTPDYKKLSIATQDLLEQYRELSNNNIHFSVGRPGEDLSDSARYGLYDSLARLGVIFENNENFSDKDQKQSQQIIIPSALISVEGKRPIAVDLRSSRTIFKNFNVINDNPEPDKEATLNAAEALLEYKFSNAINKLTRQKVPTIAYLVGNGEPIDLTINDLGESLRNDYKLGVFDLKTAYPNPESIDALLIVKPSQTFSDTDKIKLDQYVMHGGKILWFVDKLYAELDSLMNSKKDFVAYDRNLQLDDILFKYGVRLNANLLQDLNCAKLPIVVGYNPDNSPRMQRMPWPYYPFLSAINNNPISSNLDRVLSIFPSTIDTVGAEGIQKTILLASDTNSRLLASPAMVSLSSWQDDPDFRTFNKAHLPVAVLLEGKFKSLYANRLTQPDLDSIQTNLGKPFLPQAEKSTQQIVVSNAGIATNGIMQTTGPLPMGELPFDQYRFANRDFLLNSVDFLTSQNHLFVARNKDFVLRLLDKQKVDEQKSMWQFVNIALPIILILACGFLFQYIRKRNYQNL